MAFEAQFKATTQNWPSSSRSRLSATAADASQVQTTKESNETGAERTTRPNKQTSPTEDLRRSTHPNASRCYTCGESGHRQTTCPKTTKRGLLNDEVKWDDEDTELHEDALDLEEERNEGDRGNFLMLRRVCLAHMRQDDHPWHALTSSLQRAQ